MSRRGFNCLKHISYAMLVLGLVLVVTEIGLRWRTTGSSLSIETRCDSAQLLVKSWLMHHRMKPLQSVQTKNPDSGQPVKFQTNSFGLRGPEVAVPKPKNVYRILCLGDESTLGLMTDESSTFCQQLQQQLQAEIPPAKNGQTDLRIEVINAGIPGYCPLLSYLLLKHSLLSFQPDLVVVNFDMSDVSDDHRYRWRTQVDDSGRPLACRYAETTQQVALKNRRRDRFLLVTWGRQKLGRLSTNQMSQEEREDIDSVTGRYAWLKDRPPNWSAYIQQAMNPLGHLQQLVSQIDAKLLVSACPAPWQVSKQASNSAAVRSKAGVPENTVYLSDAPFTALRNFLQRQRIPFCNPVKIFRETGNSERLFLQQAPYFSEAGHALYARELSRAILPILVR